MSRPSYKWASAAVWVFHDRLFGRLIVFAINSFCAIASRRAPLLTADRTVECHSAGDARLPTAQSHQEIGSHHPGSSINSTLTVAVRRP